MKPGLRELWRHSALPILLLLITLFALGAYLQSLAVRLQSQPLVIDVAQAPEGVKANGELSLEQAPSSEGEPSELGLPTGPAAEALHELKGGNAEAALAELRRLIEQDRSLRKNPRVILPMAISLARADRAQEALILLEGLPPGNAAEANVSFQKGLIYQRLGNTQKAGEEYGKALKLRPTYWEAGFNLGTLYLTNGKYGEAISVLSATVALGGGEKRARTLFNMGIAYTQAGMLLNAEKAYLEAINLTPSNLKARINLAQLYREKMDKARQAARVYQEVLRLDDTYAPAYFGQAMLKRDEANNTEAESLLEKAIALNPSYEEARQQLAALLFDRGEVEKARAQLAWITENSEAPAEAYFEMGRLEFARRQYKAAADLYRKAYELSGGRHLAALNNLALSLKAVGEVEKAKETFLEALKKQPDYQNAHFNLGLLYLDDGDYRAAQSSFERAVTLDPKSEDSWYNLGVVYGLRNSPRKAISAYESALGAQPSDLKARLNLAVQYGKVGDYEMAVEQYKLVVSMRPSYAAAWYNLALAQKELGKWSEAEQAYKTAIKLEPAETKYRMNLGVLYSSQDRIGEAMDVYKEALEINPEDVGLRYNLALQYKKTAKTDLALQELQKAVSLDPGFKKGWLALAELYSDADNHTAAAEAFVKALEADPDDAFTRYQLGKQYYDLKDYTQAVSLLEKALESIQDNPWIWYNLGKARQALDQEAAAQKAYNQALSLDPGMGRFIYRRLGEAEDSVQLIRSLLKNDPNNTALRLQLAEQLNRQGSNKEALEEIQRVIKADPKEPAAWKTLAAIYLEQDELARAEETLRQARALFPNGGDIAYTYGRLLVKQERREQALPHLEFAAGRASKPVDALRLLGNVQYDLKDFPSAAGSFSKALELEPSDGNTMLDLGKAYYRNKTYEQALKWFLEARRRLPGYPWSGIWLGRAHVALKQYDRAEAVFKQVMEQDPNFIQGYISLGDLAVKANDSSAAREYYRRALQIDPFHQSTKDKLSKLE